MKKLLSILLGLGAFAVHAQTIPGVSYTDQHVIIDINKACYSRGKSQLCDLTSEGINFKLVGSGTRASYDPFIYSNQKIITTIPVVKITTACSSYCGTWVGNTLSGRSGYTNNAEFPSPGYTEVNINTDYAQTLDKVYLSTGIPSYLRDNFSASNALLKSSYQGVLRNVTMFRNEIAKSHRGHLERFMAALQAGVTLLEAKDAQQKLLYTVMDWRVQENSRLIVVFGTVLNELLTDYDDVDRLKISIQAMRTVVDQLRLTYGWNRGLAGTVSKASSSLIEVVRLELQELASIKMAMGSGDFTIYLDLLRITRSLQAKVDAARSGDMKAQREIFEFLDKWNEKAWQDEMSRLMNAGPDFKNLVVPKLSMLLFAMESISDLTEMEFIIPDRTQLNK